MRLYLSSSLLGDHADKLIEMSGPAARVAIIPNALDNFPNFQRDYFRETVAPLFSTLGFRAEALDLRRYFEHPSALATDIQGFDILWAIGGNSFLLRRAMKHSGFDAAARSLLQGSSVIYGGWSAGTVVAGKDLFGIDGVDDPLASAPGYPPSDVVCEGLAFVQATLVPHVDSDHAESVAAGKSVAMIRDSGRSVIALRDGEVLVQDDGEASVLART